MENNNNNNITFKLFHKDEIRRVTIPRPSFPSFVQFLHEIFGGLKSEVKISYVDSDGDKITVNSEAEWNCALEDMKEQKIVKFTIESGLPKRVNPSQPIQLNCQFYSTSGGEEVPQSKLQLLADVVPMILQKYFKGPVRPDTVPDWLASVVKVIPVCPPDFDLDVDIPRLFDVLHQRAYNLLSSTDSEKIIQAKFLLEDCLTLQSNSHIALYNLACAEAILGEIAPALLHLKGAVDNGYKNWSHMENDEDLKNLRQAPGFKALIQGLKEDKDRIAQEAREKEAHEKEAHEKEAHEKEAREKEAREKEAREKEAREKEAREKEVAEAVQKKALQEANMRALELIRFAEQRRKKLEEETKERTKKELEAAMQESAHRKQVEEEEALAHALKIEAAKAEQRKKWASSIELLKEMGFEMTAANIEKLDRVQGDVPSFLDSL